MKKLVLLLTFAGMALAESFSGTLTDVMCKDKVMASAADHTRKCAMGCAKSGYGIVLNDGTFLKFDAAGNQKALAALKASSKEKDLKATVNGTKEGDTIKVDSVQLD